MVTNAIGNKGNLALIESAIEEFIEHIDSNEYEEEMIDALESI